MYNRFKRNKLKIVSPKVYISFVPFLPVDTVFGHVRVVFFCCPLEVSPSPVIEPTK